MEPNGRPFNETLTDRRKMGKISVQYRLKLNGAGKFWGLTVLPSKNRSHLVQVRSTNLNLTVEGTVPLPTCV